MENLPALSGLTAPARVHDRHGGNRRGAEAFRRALQQQGDDQPAPPQDAAEAEAPLRTDLQRRSAAGRRDAGATSRHVDVIA
jgi:hypothetical protein